LLNISWALIDSRPGGRRKDLVLWPAQRNSLSANLVAICFCLNTFRGGG